ncbi:MAG: class I SAM-dependent rRNA methyltransferase [Bacteroidales bacterium]|nr:class I SAM-dependent rRNA methyltransferase [Candidatus Physcousia equi]
MKTVYLKKGKEDSLLRFHPWVFSGAVHHIDNQRPAQPGQQLDFRHCGIEEGEMVRVADANGKFLAVGHWQIGSIVVRVLSFCDEPIVAQFWKNRLQVALDARIAIGVADNPANDTYRLVHGEGDNLPGLVIDVYGKTAVMQAHSVGMHTDRLTIAQALIEVMDGRLENVYYKSETTLPYKAELGQENGFLIGQTNENIALENGLKFHIDWFRGQKTGFFVDQRDNRSLLEHYSKGRRVLNMFCYTGGFSVYSMRGGAELVHSVDSSAKAVELVNRNIELNFPGDSRHKAFAEDAFKFLDEMGDGYDLIILDPPAFAKHKDALRHALKGYTKINQKALEKIRPGGILFTFSCSQAVSKEQFRTAVFTACALAGRRARILHQLHQPADHPINIYHPEGEYLKGLVLYIE